MSATKDLCTNEIVSFRLMRSPVVSHFVDEFRMLIDKISPIERRNLMIHSDQGFQYSHPAFSQLLREAGIKQSMSRRGNCLDNAPIESFFGHLKDELNLKECLAFEEVDKEVKRAIKYYNYERPQAALNKKPPVEYRGLLSGFF